MMSRTRNQHHRGQTSYSVGYGKPPVRTRFRPGQSGNPKGRPKGSKNTSTIIAQVLTEKVLVRVGSREHRMSRLEATVRTIINRAMKDPRAAALVINWAEHHGLLAAEPGSIKIEVEYVSPKKKKDGSLIEVDRWEQKQ